jgi:hypothetical protein
MDMRGRAVPPRPTGEGLPDVQLQRQIADAVHHAITTLLQRDGSDCCAWYAAIAANIMPHITSWKYTINSGSLQLATAPNGDGFEMNAQSPLIADAEFHSVLVRDHGNGRFEIADLASRHWQTWAQRLGAPWQAPEPPLWVWCWNTDLHAQWPLGISYQADVALTQRHIAYITTGPGMPLLRQLSGAALQQMGRGR